MSKVETDAVREFGAAAGEAVSVFMLNPETFEKSLAVGYPDPFSAYFAGRGGVLGEASATTVNAVFAVFEPNLVKTCWETGVGVHNAAESARQYWDQVAEFGRRHLAGAEGVDRIAELGEKVIADAPEPGLPLYAGWRAMPLADDAPARALQVMFVLRELRAAVHFNALTISGITPVEAHILNHGTDYAAFMGWQPPYVDAADKKVLYGEVEDTTNRRMAQLFSAALSPAETEELARLSTAALASLKASAPPPVGS
ncbi:MAG: evbL [Mycobacterium sp.]|nr:evbL [Mycobacterium sp.]